MLDSSLPSLSDSASALRVLTERLSGVAIDLATELPKATRSLQEVSPELAERRRPARRALHPPGHGRDRLGAAHGGGRRHHSRACGASCA